MVNLPADIDRSTSVRLDSASLTLDGHTQTPRMYPSFLGGSDVVLEHQNHIVSVHATLTRELADRLYDLVSAGFQQLNEASPLRQDMVREEFIEDSLSPDVLKVLVSERNAKGRFDTVSGIALAHRGLERITWSNSKYLEGVSGDGNRLSQESIFYLSAIVVKRNRRGFGAVFPILRGIAAWFEAAISRSDGRMTCFFDHADANANLPRLVRRSLERNTEKNGGWRITVDEVGSHNWWLSEVLDSSDQVVPTSVGPELELAGTGEEYNAYVAACSQAGIQNSPGRMILSSSDFLSALYDPQIVKVRVREGGPLLFAYKQLSSRFSSAYFERRVGSGSTMFIPSIEAYVAFPGAVEEAVSRARMGLQSPVVLLTDTATSAPAELDLRVISKVEKIETQRWSRVMASPF